jgi:hypothetical protein
MLPTIGAIRPNAPWPANRAATFNMTRHHILPYNLLRDTWNLLIAAFTATQLAEARTAIRQFLGVCNHRLPNVDTLLDRMRANHLTVPECNLLAETAVWSAWNIVEGPSLRSDDPGDSGLDRFTFGVTFDEFKRMGVIENLYHALQQFAALPAPTAASLRTLIGELGVPRMTFTFVDHPIPFRPEMWEKEGTLWHKRRSGEQFLVVRAVR